MKPHPDSILIYNKIKKDSGLTDEALKLLNITPIRLTESYKQCLSKGLSRKVAMSTIYNLWKSSNPDTKQTHPTGKEMELLGFELHHNTWKHKHTAIEIGVSLLPSMTFQEVETMVLNAKSQQGG